MNEKIYSITELKKIIAPIALQHGITRVFLFGSYARGSATYSSDIDLCIDAKHLKGMFALGGLYADLQDALDKELDLITVSSLQYNKDSSFLENLRREQVLLYECA